MALIGRSFPNDGRMILPVASPSGIPAVVAFALSQLPAGSLKLDVDPAKITPSGGTVSSFTDATGGYTFTASNAATYNASYAPANGKATLGFDGTSTMFTAPGTLPTTSWIFIVWERLAQNNTSTSNTRTVFEYPNPTTNLRQGYGSLRSTQDSPQTTMQINAAGGTFSGAHNIGIDSTIHVSELQIESTGNASANFDGAELSNRKTTTGATTLPSINLGGSTIAASDRAGMNLARLIVVDYSLIPGGRRNLYAKKLIAAHLQWTYGRQAALPGTSPWTARAPIATDWRTYSPVIQTYGNSIGAYVNPFLLTALNYGSSTSVANISYGSRGVAMARSDVGGTTSTTIKGRLDNKENTGTGTNDGSDVNKQLEGIVLIGEFIQNGPSSPTGNNTTDFNTMKTELAAMVTSIETQQGASAGQGRIGIWQGWVSWNNQSILGTALRDTIIAYNNWLAATYPNYLIKNGAGQGTSDYAVSTSAPGSPYADPTYNTRGQPALSLNRNADNTHPDDTLSNLIAINVIQPWLISKGWAL